MLILIRGLPGSGKSTFAKVVNHDHIGIHIEADMFHVDINGNYAFDATLIPAAHAWCINTARIFMNNRRSVIVSNTFTTLKEMKPYLEHAKLIGTDVIVYRMTSNFGNIHNVPEEVLTKMAERFQDFETELFVGGDNEIRISSNKDPF